MDRVSSVAELIRLWPSAEIFGDDLGLKYRSYGRTMRVRGAIPENHWDAVVLSASKRDISGVDHALLRRLHAAQPVQADAVSA